MRASAVALVLVAACGARTGLRTGTPSSTDGGTDSASDAQSSACPFIAQIAQTGPKPDAIAIAGGFVYWHDAQGISRVSESGGAVEHVVSTPATLWPDLAPFSIGGGFVFFADAQSIVSRVPITGGTPMPIGLASVNAGFSASTQHFYFWGRTVGPSQITQVDFSGASFDSYDILSQPPNKLVFDGDDAHAIAAANGVFEVHKNGDQILSGLTATDVVFDSTSIYFTSDDATNGPRVIVLDLQSQKTTPMPDTFGSFAIAIDETDLYVTDRNAMRIRRIEGKTGPLHDITIEPANTEPLDLALDGACIFWTRSPQFSDTDPGAIMVAPKR